MTRTTDRPADFERELLPGGLEVRSLPGKERIEARAAGDGTKTLVGYGSVSNQVTTIEGWFSEWDEVVLDGAWAKTIDGGDIRSMFNHDTNWLLGRTKSGSLRLSENTTGLLYETDINPDDVNALSVYAKVERGDVDGSSVWFRIVAEKWEYPSDDNDLERPKRSIIEAQLFETGPVVFPAFEQTTATARSLAALDPVLRAAGIDKASRRARLASDLISDPSALEAQVRTLFATAPDLRDAVCSCSATSPHQAASEAPGDGNGTPSRGHAPPLDIYTARARALSSRFGLTLASKEQP